MSRRSAPRGPAHIDAFELSSAEAMPGEDFMAAGTVGDENRRGHGTALRSARRIEAARGYLALAMPGHALTELEAACQLETPSFDLWRLKGDALRSLERFAEAAGAYNRALAERPDALTAQLGVVACYRQLGRIDRAVAAMEEANRLHPNEPAVLVSLARLYAVSGEAGRALDWLGRAVRICPDIAGWAEQDEDFAALATAPRFRAMIESALLRLQA